MELDINLQATCKIDQDIAHNIYEKKPTTPQMATYICKLVGVLIHENY